MVSSNVLLRKSSNVENHPPGSSKFICRDKVMQLSAETTIREASRRRRARFQVGVHAPEAEVQKALRRSQQKKIRLEVPVASRFNMDLDKEGAELPRKMNVQLPKRLSRPTYPPIAPEFVSQIDPTLEGLPVQYVRDGFEALGKDLVKVLMNVKAEAAKDVLPTHMSIRVNDLSADVPSHMLGVYKAGTSKGTRKITLYPVHYIVLAANCSAIPMFPRSRPAKPETPGSTITIPVVTLALPDPDSFPLLSAFVYTKRLDHILAALLPTPPSSIDVMDPTTVEVCMFANELAATYTVQALFLHAMKVSALWRTTCALGVMDERLWKVIDFSWGVLLAAIAVSTGQPENAPEVLV